MADATQVNKLKLFEDMLRRTVLSTANTARVGCWVASIQLLSTATSTMSFLVEAGGRSIPVSFPSLTAKVKTPELRSKLHNS